jgi:hypothetical protein
MYKRQKVARLEVRTEPWDNTKIDLVQRRREKVNRTVRGQVNVKSHLQ